jgi:site-specific recombinase XerD
MKQNTFSVHFVVRSDRVNDDGYGPIYAKVTLNGKPLLLTANHKIKIQDWNTKKGIPLPRASNCIGINEAIQALETRIRTAYSKLVASSEFITVDALKAEILGKDKPTEKVHLLIETTVEHNQNFSKQVGIKYSEGSYKNYRTSLKYYQEFVPLHYRKKDIPLSLVNYKFCEAFFIFLTTKKACKTNGANKQLQRVRKIIHYAINQGYIFNNPMAAYKLVNTIVNKQALTNEELDRIQALELNREVLMNVRDVFLFQAYTGLSYSDAKRLTANDIQVDGKGDYWVRMERKKTLVAFNVPLLAQALIILEKYLKEKVGKEPLLPVISNQKMNVNLKLIQELAKVSKHLTTHLARHTFATTITLSNGVPIETVSRMLGHTKLATTQIYAKVLDGKISEDMELLKERLKNKKRID